MSDSVTTVQHVGQQTIYVLLGNIFTLSVGLPLQIYISRVLGADGIGTYSLIEAAFVTVTGLLSLGIAPAVARFIPAYLEREQYNSARKLIRNGALVLLGVGASAFLFVMANLGWIVKWWPDAALHKNTIAVMALMIPLGLLLYFLQQGLRGFQEIRYLVIGSSIMQLTVKAGVVVIALAVGMRIQGYALATVIATLSAVIWMGLGLLFKLRGLPRGPEQKRETTHGEWRSYAAISFASSIIGACTNNLDRFFLGFFGGGIAVGVFVVARQLQQLPQQINTTLLMVTAPMFSAAHTRDDIVQRQHLYWLITDWVMRASLPLMIFLVLFARPLLSLFGAKFAMDGVDALYILVGVQFFNLAMGPIGNTALMCGLETICLRITAATAVLTTLLMIVLIPRYSLIGAAIASTCGILFSNLGGLIAIRRHLRIRWWDHRFIGWLLPSAATIAIGIGFQKINPLGGVRTFVAAPELIVAVLSMYATFGLVNISQGLHEDDKVLFRHLRSLVIWTGER